MKNNSLARRWLRAARALCFPFAFAQWVNSQRCWVCISNDPDGAWHVSIGLKHGAQKGRSLRKTMLRAFLRVDADPEWSWTTDYLRSL